MKDAILYVLIAIAALILLYPYFQLINVSKVLEQILIELHRLRTGDTREDMGNDRKH